MKVKSIVILCLVMGLANAQNINFTGVWQVDLDASDSVDAILKAQGKSRLERRVAKTMKVIQSINQSSEQMSVHIKSMAMDSTQNFPLNKQWIWIDTPKMGRVQARNYWINGHQAIVTEMQITVRNQPATMKITRRLLNAGNTMQLYLELILNNGEVYSAVRVFRRQS